MGERMREEGEERGRALGEEMGEEAVRRPSLLA